MLWVPETGVSSAAGSAAQLAQATRHHICKSEPASRPSGPPCCGTAVVQ